MADEFTDKLNAVLGNPEAMGQIMSIARVLTGEGGAPPPQEAGAAESWQAVEASEPTVQNAAPALPAPAVSNPGGEGMPDLSGILKLVGGMMGGSGSGGGGTENPLSALSELDPRLIRMGMRLFQEYNSPVDDKTALLAAIRPFVKEERFVKVDRAIQIAKLARVVRTALRAFKESKEGGEGGHV